MHLLLTVLEVGKCKMKVPADVVFGKALFFVEHFCVITPKKGKRTDKLPWTSYTRVLIPFIGALPLRPNELLEICKLQSPGLLAFGL
jgi:hypothetical protein